MEEDTGLRRAVHKTVKKVTDDIEGLQYNTAISALMMLLNEFEAHRDAATPEDIRIFLKLLAPFAPHITEELWQKLEISKYRNIGVFHSVHREPWPEYDPKRIEPDRFELVIQVNGKVRGRVTLPRGASEAEAKRAALDLPGIRQYVAAPPQKIIYVPNRLINFVG